MVIDRTADRLPALRARTRAARDFSALCRALDDQHRAEQALAREHASANDLARGWGFIGALPTASWDSLATPRPGRA
jgi:hypothetical protein